MPVELIKPNEAVAAIKDSTEIAVQKINEFSHTVLRTRGGRFGSGMGTLLEALWGFYINGELYAKYDKARGCELAWLMGHEYNDFACVRRASPWDPESRAGELLRVEAKSMNVGVDEAKGHFDELARNLRESDLLLVLLWKWKTVHGEVVYPKIRDHFVGSALSVAKLRDRLHLARRGTFVLGGKCPDGCGGNHCVHEGEPLNAAGKRERKSGPESCRSPRTSFAANFGGLVRMLKTSSDSAKREFKVGRFEDQTAHEFISFIHRNYPVEEANQYSGKEWGELAEEHQIENWKRLKKGDLVTTIRSNVPGYREILRELGSGLAD